MIVPRGNDQLRVDECPEVVERVRAQDDQVRRLAEFDRAGDVLETEDLRIGPATAAWSMTMLTAGTGRCGELVVCQHVEAAA